MMNLAQLATVYRGFKQQEGQTSATATNEVIIHVYGQVQAFISDNATLQDTAEQVVNTVTYLNDTRTDVDIDFKTLNAWAWSYINNTTILDNGITITQS
tara:strand:- start:848 stop:1144 length:297 start_codon:yes stop_codon:yes gene_type:complete